MRRAGLDYHEFAGIEQYEDWADFKQRCQDGRLFGISTKASVRYTDTQFQRDDYLIFGPESRGLPDLVREELGMDRLLRIPMTTNSRSLNLSNAAALVVYEAWRQQGFIDGR